MTPTASSNPQNQPTYVEEPASYCSPDDLNERPARFGLSVNIDRDSDFLLTGIVGGAPGFYAELPTAERPPYSNNEILSTDI